MKIRGIIHTSSWVNHNEHKGNAKSTEKRVLCVLCPTVVQPAANAVVIFTNLYPFKAPDCIYLQLKTHTMYQGIQHLHSYFAYLALAALVFAVIHTAISRNKPFTATNKKVALIGLIAAHLQLVFGLVLYFTSPLGIANLSGATMKDSTMRLLALEHPLTMLVAIILITIGYSKSKRATVDADKFKYILRMYGIGLVLILSRIPWKMWF